MKVGEHCTNQVVVGETSDSLLDVARRMRLQNTEYLVVIEKSGNYVIPKGILTGRDIVNQIILEDMDPKTMTLADIIINDTIIAREDDDVDNTIARMSEMGVRYLPVVNNSGFLTGIFTIDDFIHVLSEEVNKLRSQVRSGESPGQNLYSA